MKELSQLKKAIEILADCVDELANLSDVDLAYRGSIDARLADVRALISDATFPE